ncbi:3-phytase A [Teratosphaeria destructans]|uniref:3-phytase n=1 Tax=Teratosphaeria destructans TaxID=418781 RepID=A0A9W7W1H2_9PEZI|nr:3-phytase A [Teratosphaeria destructans]
MVTFGIRSLLGLHQPKNKYELLDRKYGLLRARDRSRLLLVAMSIALLALLGTVASLAATAPTSKWHWSGGWATYQSISCDTIKHGYQCSNNISHYWGQYSPYFSVPSDISDEVPDGCAVTFAQILSRHGARDPTASKTAAYNSTIMTLQSRVEDFTGLYAFLNNYEYTLGADQLTRFGQQELINSGIKYYQRYEGLASHLTPFVRSSGEARVVVSSQNWTQGFHDAKLADWNNKHQDTAYPYPILVIPETDGENNTLNHDLCTVFEDGPDSDIADNAQATWASIFVPPIQKRLNADMPGANLTETQTIYLMDLCPFNTVASANGTISPFCDLFTEKEWYQYGYYETLNKFYGYSYGNPLGPTQGVGFANELIARLTNKPVHEGASINRTLDENNATFPLGRKLYADFSHDNDMTAIFSALGLYNTTTLLPNTSVVETPQANGYSAAWTVPFAARAYFEKLQCRGRSDEMVRVIINDRVLPLAQCDGDQDGLCTLQSFIDSLVFARCGAEVFGQRDERQVDGRGRSGLRLGRPKRTRDRRGGVGGDGPQQPPSHDPRHGLLDRSCTKLLATMACLQAVEQGTLKLDDHQQVYQLAPELEKVKVLQEDGSLVDKKRDITLRLLLSHTSGFGYEFFSTKLQDYGRPVGFDVFHSDEREILNMPLVHQPGETWEYGIGIDWAGILLERATGMKLNDWIQQNIMKPLNLNNINMFPTESMKKNLAYMHQRWPGDQSKSEERDHVYREPLLANTPEEKARLLNSGGAGAFAPPREYVQVLATLLNDGKSPKTGAQILKKETVDLMWENQVPQLPNFARVGIPSAKPEQTNPVPELYPQEGNPPQGWGLSFMITQEPGATGRGANTAWWAGIANLFWWADREKGVAGMIASQVMPFGDPHVIGQWGACEAAIYASL